MLHFARFDLIQNRFDFREQTVTVSRATDNQAFILENIFQDIRCRALAHIVHDDILHPVCGQRSGNRFCHLFGIAIHAAVHDRHTFFTFITAHTVINIDRFCCIFTPHRTVSRTDRPDIQSRQLLQSTLYRISIFTDNIGIITEHFLPIMFHIHFRVDHTAIQRSVSTEGIGREQDFVSRIVSDHHFRPVHHRSHIERQLVTTHTQGVSFLHFIQSRRNTVIPIQHAESLLVSDNLDIRILLAQQTDTARMIRLHMVHDQKIQRTPVESIRYFFQENIGITHIHRIDQDRFLVHDQIGIIRYTIRQRPHILKKSFLPVVYPYIVNFICYFF